MTPKKNIKKCYGQDIRYAWQITFKVIKGDIRLSQNDGIKAAYILVNFLKGADDVV